jgi:hypothetical protein
VRGDGGGPANDQDPFRIFRGNLVWLRPALASSSDDLVSVETVNQVALQLFVSLCDTCLGLGPADPQVRFTTMFVLFRQGR